MICFGVVGTGWRTRFFLRVAQARPDLFKVVGVLTRDVERAGEWARPYGVRLVSTIDDLLAQQPMFVVTSVPGRVNPTVVKELADRGMPVLSETPPAPSVAEMAELYQLVRQDRKIAVAEQYHLQPHHAVRIALANSGKLGTVTQAQVSAAHGYHGISLIRRLLNIGFEDVTITGHQFKSPIVHGPERSGPPEHEEIVESIQTIAYLDFGDKLGIFDFTTDQYRSYIRKQRVLVRGERGELINDRVIYLQDYLTPIQLDFQRHNTGGWGNLEGFFFKGIQLGSEWVYKNGLAPAPLNDEDIAVGQCLLKMADYVDGGEPFYSLAEACQDRYLHLTMDEAIATGKAVTTTHQVWAG